MEHHGGRWLLFLLSIILLVADERTEAFGSNHLGRLHSGQRLSSPLLKMVAATDKPVVVVVGGGVSGMVAAATAAQRQPDQTVIMLEAHDRVGGRVQTDVVVTTCTDATFRFDRGFAVFLEEYPMAQQLLDYDALDLRPFVPGAVVQTKEWGRVRIADPLRQPSSLWDALRFPIGTLRDRIQLARLVWHVRTHSIEDLFAEEETDTERVLRLRWHLSDAMIDQFFRPFLQGIYLCSLDQQSSRMFHFVFKMFSKGRVSLPSHGMAAVSEQLLGQCTAAGVQVHTKTVVDGIEQQSDGTYRVMCNGVSTASYDATQVIVATESPVTERLLQPFLREPQQEKTEQQRQQRSIGCVYYSFQGEPPIDEPILVLNGIGEGPINNLCFPTVVSPHYAPEGTHVCSVTVLAQYLEDFRDDVALDQAVRQQLVAWFPEHNIADDWTMERIYRIRNAQPAQYPPAGHSSNSSSLSCVDPSCTLYKSTTLPFGLLVCGDHMATASLQGALTSGLLAGEQAAVAKVTD